ncbi:hypothetical protein HDU67_004797 [Dinochytrium kinnereticum]|nr:hypothetical protein HDU67_004797 [Dinochytrium kinnereticum]
MLLPTTLLLFPLFASAQTSNDPCKDLSNIKVPTLAEVYSCYDSFTDPTETQVAHVRTIKQFMEVYPYTDINMNSPEGLFPSKFDVIGELDTIEKEPSNTRFQLYSKISRVLLALNDPGVRLVPRCTAQYKFFQPWHMAAVSSNGSVQIKLVDTVSIKDYAVPFWGDLGGVAPASYINYTVKSIDDVDAVKSVQEFADTLSGFSKSPDARFNSVLYSRKYDDGKFKDSVGQFYFTNFLGHSISPNRTYVLTPPNGGADVTISVPWAAIYSIEKPREKVPFNSKKSYEDRHCKIEKKRSSKNRREINDWASIWAAEDNSMELPDLDLPLNEDDSWISAFKEDLLQGRENGAVTPGLLDLEAPVAKDKNSAFYMLEDGLTGVWVLPNLNSKSEKLLTKRAEVVSDGLNELRERGAKKLVIDLSGNQDGDSCVGYGLAQYLLGNITAVADQVRLTPLIQTLMKADFLGFGSKKISTKTSNSRFNIVSKSNNVIKNSFKQDRGGGAWGFSEPFYYCQERKSLESEVFHSVEPLRQRWEAEDIAIVSDGGCRGACGLMVRSIRDAHKVKVFTYGGSSLKPYTPTSGEGGTIMTFDDIAKLRSSKGLSKKDRDSIPKGFSVPVSGYMLVTQSLIPSGENETRYPSEWIPQPSDEYVDVSEPFDKAALWIAVATRLSPTVPTTSITITATATATTGVNYLPRKDLGTDTIVLGKNSGVAGSAMGQIVGIATILASLAMLLV